MNTVAINLLQGRLSPVHLTSRLAGRQAAVSLVAVSVILSVDHYHAFAEAPVVKEACLYLLLPLAIVVLLFRQSPLHYGLGLGRWREGLAWTAGGVLLMLGVAWLFLRLPEFPAFYEGYFAARNPGGQFWTGTILTGLQMFSWEFLFRGFLLFALAEQFGSQAILIQTVPFALAHFGKPEWETYSSIAGGALSGWIAYRVRSFYPSWIIHWALAFGMSWLLGG